MNSVEKKCRNKTVICGCHMRCQKQMGHQGMCAKTRRGRTFRWHTARRVDSFTQIVNEESGR